MKNEQSNGGNEFACGFIKCIYQTPEDFKVGWQELVLHHGVQQRKWALDLYNDRKKWVEAYL